MEPNRELGNVNFSLKKSQSKSKFTIKRNVEKKEKCRHGKLRRFHSKDENPAAPGDEGGSSPEELNLETLATANLLTPTTSTSSSLGAVAWRRRDITEAEPQPQPPKNHLEEVKQSSPMSKGSLAKIRDDLHKLGVKTGGLNHVSITRNINVFDDKAWEEYGKHGDVLVFDLGPHDEIVYKMQNSNITVLTCEEQEESTMYPWRGRGRYNAEWTIKHNTDKTNEFYPAEIGDFAGGLMCRRLAGTKVISTHQDKVQAFKVHERTSNPNIQKLIMSLGNTPETDRSVVTANGQPDFYAEVDEYSTYLESEGTPAGDGKFASPPTNPYYKQEQSSEQDQDEDCDKATLTKSHHDFEVDPQTCWPCVGCQDDDVPKTIRWCSVM